MINQRNAIMLSVCSVALVVVALLIIVDSISRLPSLIADSSAFNDPAASKRLSLINKAVYVPLADKQFEYIAEFDTPFKRWKDRASVNRSSRATTASRLVLSLKGTLLKKRSLAIIENGNGETQIRAEGEKAFDQTIIKISKNSVTLLDHLGRYEINVEEP